MITETKREWFNEIIHWANGGEIERYDTLTSEWEDDPHPDFYSYNQYRKKVEVPTYWCYRPAGEEQWKAYDDMKKHTHNEMMEAFKDLINWEFHPIF